MTPDAGGNRCYDTVEKLKRQLSLTLKSSFKMSVLYLEIRILCTNAMDSRLMYNGSKPYEAE